MLSLISLSGNPQIDELCLLFYLHISFAYISFTSRALPKFCDPVACLEGLSSRPFNRFCNNSKTHLRLWPRLSTKMQITLFRTCLLRPYLIEHFFSPKAGFHTRNCLQKAADSVHWYPHTGLRSRGSLSVFDRSGSSSLFCHTLGTDLICWYSSKQQPWTEVDSEVVQHDLQGQKNNHSNDCHLMNRWSDVSGGNVFHFVSNLSYYHIFNLTFTKCKMNKTRI